MSNVRRMHGRSRQRMRSGRLTGPDAPAIEVPGRYLLCAVCVRGGCRRPPVDMSLIRRLLKAVWEYPFTALRIMADVDVTRVHYLDAYGKWGAKPLPRGVAGVQPDYVGRRRDLEVVRRLGIAPNTVLPAYHAFKILFSRLRRLDGVCRGTQRGSAVWPDCPHARKRYYEKVVASGGNWNLADQTELGERMDGKGLWAMVRPRTRQDMTSAKLASTRFITEHARRLFIRPSHLLCILCSADSRKVLIQDNLIELLRRMKAEPDIPVTLTEGCCMVCDPCNVYHPGEHLCYHGHIKSNLRDLMVLQKLDVAPGATLPAWKMYQRVYRCIGTLTDICGWGDGSNTAPFWSPCQDRAGMRRADRHYQVLRGKRFLARPPQR